MNAKIVLILIACISSGLRAQPKAKTVAKLECPDGLVPDPNGKKTCVDYLGYEPQPFTLHLPETSSAPSESGTSPPPLPNSPKSRRFPLKYILYSSLALLAFLSPFAGVFLYRKINEDRSVAWHYARIFEKQFDERRNKNSSVYPNLYKLVCSISWFFGYRGVVKITQNPGHDEVQFEDLQSVADNETREIIRQLQATNGELDWSVKLEEGLITVQIKGKRRSHGKTETAHEAVY